MCFTLCPRTLHLGKRLSTVPTGGGLLPPGVHWQYIEDIFGYGHEEGEATDI